MSSIMLYHHPLSVCSMKVRLALEEKGLAWSDRVIDIVHKQEQLDPWYLKINPKGVVPTLEYRNGTTKTITDSARIIRFIAQLSQGNSLVTDQEHELQLMEKLINQADEIDLQILSYARHPSLEKSENILNERIDKAKSMSLQHPELKENYRACADRSEKNKTFRVDKSHVELIEQQAETALAFIERQLKEGPFLLGHDYTLADVIWTVVLSRLDLLEYHEWVKGNQFPLVAKYYEQVQTRKSYSLAKIQNSWWEQ